MRGPTITAEESKAYYEDWITGKSIADIAVKFSKDSRTIGRALEKEMARRQMMKGMESKLSACA